MGAKSHKLQFVEGLSLWQTMCSTALLLVGMSWFWGGCYSTQPPGNAKESGVEPRESASAVSISIDEGTQKVQPVKTPAPHLQVDPGFVRAIQEASRDIHAIRAWSAPSIWGCSNAQKKQLNHERRRHALRSWSDAQASAWSEDELLRERVGHDEAYWTRIRWLYVEKGYCNTESFVVDGVTEVSFFGHTMRVHPRVAHR